MAVQRLAFAALALLAALSIYSLGVASQRFGDAAQTFDRIELELAGFNYERGSQTVAFALRVDNPGRNDARVTFIEYAFVINGVVAGGGDARPGATIPPGESLVLDLQGRINDVLYVERQPTDEPLGWLVNARIQVNVDERLDSAFIPFSFRTETP